MIVFSHGSVNDPMNEVTDTQGDARIDFIHQQAGAANANGGR